MATVKASVLCNGRDLNFYSLNLDQKFNWHHTFKIMISSESIEGKKSINIDKSVEYLGEIVDIEITSINKLEGKGLNFKGIITAVNIDRTFTGDNMIVLSGYSPTYLLEDGKGCESFEEMNGGDIFGSITGNYPGNLLNTQKNPNNNRIFPYHTKYKETNYEYLSRIADTNGEWLYYNGKNFVFGKIEDVNNFDIVLGRDLSSYEYGVSMKSSLFNYITYDYEKNENHEKDSNSTKPSWLDKYGKDAQKMGDQHFPAKHKHPVTFDVTLNSDLNDQVKIQREALLSNSTMFTGESTNPSIMVSSNVGITASGSFLNRFRVINVSHYVDASKNYTNSFEALPLTVAAPPVNKNVYLPKAERQMAIVKKHDDDKGMGRVRVQMFWQTGSEMTPFIRVATSSSGDDRGMYFVPEEGDQVILDFEYGNPDRPYVAATTYHGKAKSTWQCGENKNNLKAIKTRSGHTILLDDTDGKEIIHIHDKKENEIIIDTDKETITIKALKNINIEAGEDIVMKAGKNIKMTASEENIEMEAKKNLEVKAEANVEFTATKKFINKAMDIEAKATKGFKMSGLDVEAKGSKGLKLSGAQSELKGSATCDVKGLKVSVGATAMAELKGAIVKIN